MNCFPNCLILQVLCICEAKKPVSRDLLKQRVACLIMGNLHIMNGAVKARPVLENIGGYTNNSIILTAHTLFIYDNVPLNCAPISS